MTTDRVERFWSARDALVSLDDDGFLADPLVTSWGASLNPYVREQDALRCVRCLVLLGEPGSGKSTALGMEPNSASDVGILPVEFVDTVLAVNLADYGDEQRLAALLDSDVISAWRVGDGELALILDAFDECQMRIDHLARMISLRVQSWPTDRLILRIGCRTAQWHTVLEGALKASFAETFEVVEVSPLRAVDLVAIAKTRGLDGNAVLASVRAAHAGALASRPLLLKMLLDDYAAGIHASDTLDMYRRGTRRLADEHDPLRTGPRPRRAAPGHEAIAVARRLAALVVFTGRAALTPATEREGSLLGIDDALGVPEVSDGAPLDLTRHAITEVLESALFTSRGLDRLGFAHFSFAEFLAAEWLDAHSLDKHQLSQLLRGADGVVFPALRNVAAWLIALNPGRYGWIAGDDPDVILSGAVDIPSGEIRAAVVDRLFREADLYRWRFRNLANVTHPGLASQIRVELQSDDVPRRQLACVLAGACSVGEVEPDLMAVVLDPEGPASIRARAASAVAQLGQPTPMTLAALLPGPIEGDDDDELLGVALRASFPHAVDLRTVLAALSVPKRSNLLGSYRIFLIRDLPPQLRSSDLDVALPWLLERERSLGRHDSLDVLADAIVSLTCRLRDRPDLDAALAELVWHRTTQYEGLLLDRVPVRERVDPLADDTRRRQILVALVERSTASDQQHNWWYIADGSPDGHAVARPADFGWLAEHLDDFDPSARQAAIDLAVQLFTPYSPDAREALLALPDGHPVQEQLLYWLGSMPIDHPAGAGRPIKRTRPTGPSDVEVERRINKLLDNFENGERDAFWQADVAVATSPGAQRAHIPFKANMAERDRWPKLSEATKSRLTAAAHAYVLNGRSETEHWLGKSVFHYPSSAGVHALVLLLERAPELVATLPTSAWKAWAPSIIDAARWTDTSLRATELLEGAAANAIAELRASALAQLDADTTMNLKDEIATILWHPDFETGLVELAQRVDDDRRSALVELIARHNLDVVRARLTSEVADASSSRRADSACLLLVYGTAGDWRTVLSHAYADEEFGLSLMLANASQMRRASQPPLDPSEIVKLYAWLIAKFPPAEDPDIAGAHAVGPREELADWRDELLMPLVSEASDASVAALRTLAARMPESNSVRARLHDAEEQRRRNDHQLLEPVELLGLTRAGRAVLVRSASELRHLLVTILGDIERYNLQGNIPEARHLWDETVMKPKSEDSIADFIANRIRERMETLDDVSATALREVQTRRDTPSGIGQRADIVVHARRGDTPLTVIIECKGCWNAGLESAMRSQLLGQYLADMPGADGIYLAFWFDTDVWSTNDPNRTKCQSSSREQLRERLEKQATELRDEGFGVSAVVIDASYRRPEPR